MASPNFSAIGAANTVNGMAQVVVGAAGQAFNRNMNSATTSWANSTNTVTWSNPVKDLSIHVPATASLSYVLVVYDAPNDLVAATWLADAGGVSSDVSYDLIPAGQIFSKQMATGITRIDVLPVGANTRVLVGAV